MTKLLVAGAGQIGSAITHLMSTQKDVDIWLADQQFRNLHDVIKNKSNVHLKEIDVSNTQELTSFINEHQIDGVISCLPFFLNKMIAQIAFNTEIDYFDMTEDINVSAFVTELSAHAKTAFVTQCGLAPGFINITANHLMQKFDQLDTVKLRCGGLPINSSNELKYAFTWSIDGLINEYAKPCLAIENGLLTRLTPLANLEQIQIDGLNYEAFNTSGGIGSLTETFKGRVDSMTYKTIRYPGHRDKIKFLIQDLKLGRNPEALKKILANAIPHTRDDVVILFISVLGKIDHKLKRKSFVTKYYPQRIEGVKYSALQLTTASSASAVLSIVLNSKKYKGHIKQESFDLDSVLKSPFGQYLKEKHNG